jgi:hypothetical protein
MLKLTRGCSSEAKRSRELLDAGYRPYLKNKLHNISNISSMIEEKATSLLIKTTIGRTPLSIAVLSGLVPDEEIGLMARAIFGPKRRVTVEKGDDPLKKSTYQLGPDRPIGIALENSGVFREYRLEDPNRYPLLESRLTRRLFRFLQDRELEQRRRR